MIALRNGLPLIQNEDGTVSNFDPGWLSTVLMSAAGKAGHHGWWLIDDLVVGISTYLRENFEGSIIDLAELETVIRTTLHDVGYDEVALSFRSLMPCPKISLARLLRSHNRNNLTEFFERLEAQIARLHAAKVQHVHFSDLGKCVRELASAGPVESVDLLHQVVTFVRERVQSLPWQTQLRCSIS